MEQFYAFWSQYPKKVGFKTTRDLFMSLSAEQKVKAVESIGLHAELWKKEGRESKFIPYPYSWISGERFEDEIELPTGVKNGKFSVNQYITKKFASGLDASVTQEVFGDLHGKIYPLLRRA